MLSTKNILSYKARRKLRSSSPLKLSKNNLNPRIVLHFSKNNIFFNLICRLKNKPFLFATIFWLSCGSVKFSKPQYKGSSKTSYIANYSLGIFIAQKLQFLRFNSKIFLVIKGLGSYFNIFLKSFRLNYFFSFNVMDLTPISLNGCRLQKTRRI